MRQASENNPADLTLEPHDSSIRSSPPLGSALRDFRALLAISWSPGTALPGTLASPDCGSRGQCGVSSLWLSQILDREYSICSMFCRGEGYFGGQWAERLRNHCWLEIDGESGEPVIVDLTCDQAQTSRREIVFNSRSQLDREDVHYKLSEHINVFDLSRHSNLWRRYQRLLANMLALAPPRFGVWLPIIVILRESAEKPQDQPRNPVISQHFEERMALNTAAAPDCLQF
jgi:hypothetical protein